MREYPSEINEPTRREFFKKSAEAILAITLATSCKAEKTKNNPQKENKKYILSRELIFPEPESKEVVNSGMILVFFSANWCGACRRAEEFLKQQKNYFKKCGIKPYEFFNDLGVQPHKTWSPLAEGLMKTHSVKGLPTILILSDGKLIKKLYGLDSIWEIQKCLNYLTGGMDGT